jgi:hypothetical protein
VTGVGAGKSPARGLGSGCCGLCSGDETAQPRQCATLRDAIDPRENTVCSGGGRGGGVPLWRRQWRRLACSREDGAEAQHIGKRVGEVSHAFITKDTPTFNPRYGDGDDLGRRVRGREVVGGPAGTAVLSREGGSVWQGGASGEVRCSDRRSWARLGVRTVTYGAARRTRALWSAGTRWRDATSRSGVISFRLPLFDCEKL